MSVKFGKTKKLWLFWALMYCLCVVCSFIPAQQGESHGVILLLLGLSFFVPPALLIRYAARKQRNKTLTTVRNLSIISLVLTLIALLLNLLSVKGSALLGDIMHLVLAVVGAPIVCIQVPVISIFGWACVLMAAIHYLNNNDKRIGNGRKHRRHRSHRHHK